MSNRNADEQLREQLSALMDGELPREQALFLLRRMETDQTLRAQWEHMHQIRDGLNGVGTLPSPDFCSRVMTAIAAEPASSGRTALASSSRRVPRWLQTMAGGAMAAGVAWVALLSTSPQQIAPASDNSLASSQPLASPGSAATGAMLLPQQVFSQASQTSGGTPTSLRPAQLRLDRYLLRHSQALQNSSSPQVLAPYAYAVSFGDRSAPAQQAR